MSLSVKIIDSIHKICGVGTVRMKNASSVSANDLLMMDEGKEKRNLALSYIIGKFRYDSKNEIQLIVKGQVFTGVKSRSLHHDDGNEIILHIGDIYRLRKKSQHAETSKIITYLDDNNYLENKVNFMNVGSDRILAGLGTAFSVSIKCMEVYLALGGNRSRIQQSTQGVIIQISQMHLELFKKINNQISSGNGKSYVKDFFYIDSSGNLVISKTSITPEVLKSFQSEHKNDNMQPVTKCPALFSTVRTKDGSVSPIRDCISLVAEYMQ